MLSHANSDSVLDLQDIGERSRREILQTFWNNGLSDRARVYAVLTLTSTRRRYRSRNSAESHAEVNMLMFLRTRHSHDDLKNQRIVMYISTSPCYFCSRQIETLVADLGVTLELVLASLHHMNRPSSASPTDHNYHHRNVWGLRGLQRVGVVIRTFSGQDWDTFATQVLLVDCFSYAGSQRREEDEKLRMDLQSLLPGGTNETLNNNINNSDDDDDSSNNVLPTVAATATPSARPEIVLPQSVPDRSTADPQLSLFQIYVVLSLTLMLTVVLWHDVRHPHSFVRFFLETAVVAVVVVAAVVVGGVVAGGVVLAAYSDRLVLM